MKLPRLSSLTLACLAALLLLSGTAQAVNVAVLYFDNNSGQAKYDVLNKGLADMIITDLSGVPGLTLVERSRLQDILTEQKLQKSKLFDTSTSVKVGKLLGARYAVTGAVAAVEPKMRMDIRLIDVETAKIMVADKVIGESSQFFELEKQLIERFVKGLNKEMPKALQKADSLNTVLDYSEGLDLADKGDYKGASQQLAKLVSTAPQFQLAKTRYQEFLKKLYAAKAKRKSDMGSGAQSLLDACDAVLGSPARSKKRKALSEHFAYRILRGHLILAQIKKVTGASGSFTATQITPAIRPRVERLIQGWSNNQGALVAEMIDARARRQKRAYGGFTRAKPDHEKLAKELGAGHSPARMAFIRPQTGARGHAKMLCTGQPAFFSSVKFTIAPTPAEMHPGYGWYAVFLYEWAITDVLANERKDFVEREHIRTLDEYGDCLLKLKRKTDAIAKWQTVLDKYPTSSEFPRIEKKIKAALGVK